MTPLPPKPVSEREIEEALRLAASIDDWIATADWDIARPQDIARALLALQARLRESERARDHYRSNADWVAQEIALTGWKRRAEALEQERDRLRGVLREIAGYGRSRPAGWPEGHSVISAEAADVARRALAPEAQA